MEVDGSQGIRDWIPVVEAELKTVVLGFICPSDIGEPKVYGGYFTANLAGMFGNYIMCAAGKTTFDNT